MARRGSFRVLFLLLSSGALGAALSVTSCGPSFMDGLIGGRRDAAPSPDGEVEAGICTPTVLPERPDPTNPANVVDVLFALEALRLDTEGVLDAGVAAPRGLDLDGVCTCPAASSCLTPDAGVEPCDGPEGRDNALARFFNQLGRRFVGFPEDFATADILEGRSNVLLGLQGWNGEADDNSVVVTLLNSQWLDKPAHDGGRRENPRFDGTDVWSVDPESIAEGERLLDAGADCRDGICIELIADENAYVRDGELVARPKKRSTDATPIAIRTGLGRLVIELNEAVIKARITSDGSRHRLTGEIVGRWPLDKMLRAIANMESIPLPGLPTSHICQDLTTYRLVKDIVCAAADLSVTKAQDGVGAPCGAISAAISFSASPAVAGHVIRREAPTPCSDWSDTCGD